MKMKYGVHTMLAKCTPIPMDMMVEEAVFPNVIHLARTKPRMAFGLDTGQISLHLMIMWSPNIALHRNTRNVTLMLIVVSQLTLPVGVM